MESTFCVNCGSASGSMLLEDEQILYCIQQWVAPLSVQPHNFICRTCWTEASQEITNLRSGGRNCELCNMVLPLRKRSHQLIALRTDTQHHVNIRNVILERLLPLQVHASHYICHPCWQKTERSVKRYSSSSSRGTAATSVRLRCINCNINLIRLKRHILEDNVILLQIQQQITPRIATSADYICDACHTLISKRIATIASQDSSPAVGHQNVCVICGRSLLNARSHHVHAEINHNILHIVQNLIQPRELHLSENICHRCYQRAKTALYEPRDNVSVQPSNVSVQQSDLIILPNYSRANISVQQSDTIILPNYSRAPDTHSRCIFPGCTSTSQQMVPFMLRVRLFSDHNYYIPRNCRICSFHLERQSWSDLFQENMNHSFTAAYIEDFCELLKRDRHRIYFKDIKP